MMMQQQSPDNETEQNIRLKRIQSYAWIMQKLREASGENKQRRQQTTHSNQSNVAREQPSQSGESRGRKRTSDDTTDTSNVFLPGTHSDEHRDEPPLSQPPEPLQTQPPPPAGTRTAKHHGKTVTLQEIAAWTSDRVRKKLISTECGSTAKGVGNACMYLSVVRALMKVAPGTLAAKGFRGELAEDAHLLRSMVDMRLPDELKTIPHGRMSGNEHIAMISEIFLHIVFTVSAAYNGNDDICALMVFFRGNNIPPNLYDTTVTNNNVKGVVHLANPDADNRLSAHFVWLEQIP